MPADVQDVFKRIYDSGHWERGSGVGSCALHTELYRNLLQTIVSSRGIARVVDAGCGDWQFSHLVDWSSVDYLGIDAVSPLIAQDISRYARPNITFESFDFSMELIPECDLLICKDVLQHWPAAPIQWFLEKQVPRARHALITNDVESVYSDASLQNSDVPFGAWRTLDLARSPYNLEPVWQLDWPIEDKWLKRTMLLSRRPSPFDFKARRETRRLLRALDQGFAHP